MLRNFDVDKLFRDAGEYKKELMFLDQINDKIKTVSERLHVLNQNKKYTTPDMADVLDDEINKELNEYAYLKESRDQSYAVVARAEKYLGQSIDALSTLDSLDTPHGEKLRVTKSEDHLMARVQLVDNQNRVVEDIPLNMSSDEDGIKKIQGLVNDLKARQLEIQSEGVSFDDIPVQQQSIDTTVGYADRANEKLGMFAQMKRYIGQLNERVPELIEKAKDLSKVMLEHSRQAFGKLRVSINEWGQTSLGEYRSVRKAFGSLNELEDLISSNEKGIESFTREKDAANAEIYKLQLDKSRLLSSRFSVHKLWGPIEKRIENLDAKIAAVTSKVQERENALNNVLAQSKNVFKSSVDRLIHDTLDVRNKTIGNTTIEVNSTDDSVYAALISKGEVIEYVSLNRSGELTIDQIENLKHFNKAVRTLSPQSITLDTVQTEDKENETSQYLNDQRNMYRDAIGIKLANIQKLPAEVGRNSLNVHAVELMGALRDHSDFTNMGADVEYRDGQLRVTFVNSQSSNNESQYTLDIPPSVGDGLMVEIGKLANTNDIVYTQDASEDFAITSEMHMDQYKKMASQIQRQATRNKLDGTEVKKQMEALNTSTMQRLSVMNQSKLGDKTLFVTAYAGGIKMLLQDSAGKQQVVLVPVGLDGKLQFTNLEQLSRELKQAADVQRQEPKDVEREIITPHETTNEQTVEVERQSVEELPQSREQEPAAEERDIFAAIRQVRSDVATRVEEREHEKIR